MTGQSSTLGNEIEINWDLTFKQTQAWDFLHDATTAELLFGGGAGGGKSELGCGWEILMSLRYKGIRGLIGRESLKSLKESTLLTFFDVCQRWGLLEGRDFTYNGQADTIRFTQTGSTIYLKELGWLPSDPNYDRLGSTEYTFAFIDEAGQVRQKAKNTVRSRLRYKIAINGLIGKLLMTCNPTKGYLYQEFYQPYKKGTQAADKRFVPALATDNPFIDPTYIKNLLGLDKETKERLLYGNWEYDDDPSALISYDALLDLFTNAIDVKTDEGNKVLNSEKYIVCDVARFGGDRTVISYWEGLRCVRIAIFTKLATVPDPNNPHKPSVAGKIKEWREMYKVPLSHVLVDEDGVGGGVVDYLGCRGFMGGRKAMPMPRNYAVKQNFLNLRAQCSYKLAEYVNARKMAVPTINNLLKEQIIVELEQIKAKDHDKDGPLKIVPKDEIKEKIGHSPDLSDNLMMRMFFEFAPKPSIRVL